MPLGKRKGDGIPSFESTDLLVYGRNGKKEVEDCLSAKIDRRGGKDGGQRLRAEESRLWRDEIKKTMDISPRRSLI
jgi:hypothetical protein